MQAMQSHKCGREKLTCFQMVLKSKLVDIFESTLVQPKVDSLKLRSLHIHLEKGYLPVSVTILPNDEHCKLGVAYVTGYFLQIMMRHPLCQ